MTAEFSHALPRWSSGVPIAAVVALIIVWNRPLKWSLIVVVALALIASVLAAAHHAEVEAVLLALTFVVAVLTLGGGRATVMQGAVQLVMLAAFIFLAFFP